MSTTAEALEALESVEGLRADLVNAARVLTEAQAELATERAANALEVEALQAQREAEILAHRETMRERDEAKEQAALGWERHAEKDRVYGETLRERDALREAWMPYRHSKHTIEEFPDHPMTWPARLDCSWCRAFGQDIDHLDRRHRDDCPTKVARALLAPVLR